MQPANLLQRQSRMSAKRAVAYRQLLDRVSNTTKSRHTDRYRCSPLPSRRNMEHDIETSSHAGRIEPHGSKQL